MYVGLSIGDGGNDPYIEWKADAQGGVNYQLKPGSFIVDEYNAYVESMNKAIQAARLRATVSGK